jgi:hypothetical protein
MHFFNIPVANPTTKKEITIAAITAANAGLNSTNFVGSEELVTTVVAVAFIAGAPCAMLNITS